VWYTTTPVSDGFGVIDVTQSDYSAGIVVLAGSPGAFVPLACGPGVISGPFTAGQQLYFMVFGDGLTTETSGTLHLEVRLAVAPPVLEVTVDPVAGVDRFGAATITGTVTCTAPDGQGVVFGVDGSVRQRVGRGFVDGFFFADLGVPCDGTTFAWSAVAVPDGGKFAGGKAATVAFTFGCGTDQCSQAYVEAIVQMKRGRVG
jgi:cytochrome c biogenesis protein CcdA